MGLKVLDLGFRFFLMNLLSYDAIETFIDFNILLSFIGAGLKFLL